MAEAEEALEGDLRALKSKDLMAPRKGGAGVPAGDAAPGPTMGVLAPAPGATTGVAAAETGAAGAAAVEVAVEVEVVAWRGVGVVMEGRGSGASPRVGTDCTPGLGPGSTGVAAEEEGAGATVGPEPWPRSSVTRVAVLDRDRATKGESSPLASPSSSLSSLSSSPPRMLANRFWKVCRRRSPRWVLEGLAAGVCWPPGGPRTGVLQ